MEDNTRLERLLQLIERPEDFPESIKDELLEDDECRELYEKLCEVRRAMAAEQVNKEDHTPDAMREWRRFRRAHVTHRRSAWSVAVVSVASLAVVSVLAFAMLHPKGKDNDAHDGGGRPEQDVRTACNATPDDTAGTALRTAMTRPRPYIYDDETLENILGDVASVYHVGVRYARPELRAIRLYLRWNSGQTIEEVVALFNHFENIRLSLTGDTIVVE